MSSVKTEHSYVFSYPEIIGLFISFVVVLFLLYNGNHLEERVLQENSNYDLTVIYLENMLKQDPKNENLMLALAKTTQKSGNTDLSMKLLTVLVHTKNQAILEEIDTLKYYLLKETVPHLSKEKKEETLKEMNQLLISITNRPLKNMTEIKQLYDEAIWIKNNSLAYKLTSLAIEKESDPYWLKQRYALALKLHHTQEAQNTLQKLLMYDMGHKEEWLKEIYYHASNNGRYKDAEKILKKLEGITSLWKVEHAGLAIRMREYHKASEIYLSLSNETDDQKVKKMYLIKALQALQYGNLSSDAVTLAKKYENIYLNDPEMRELFLKLYLSADDLEAASNFSKKLLKKGIK